MVTLQPCGTVLHPSCVYPSVQSYVGSPNSSTLHLQGEKEIEVSINIIKFILFYFCP